MVEDNYYLKLLLESYQEQINLYQQIIEEKNAKIKELEIKITSQKTLINNRDRVIQIYNQYNYQTQESDMSNIKQTDSGSGDNVGGDKNVQPNSPSYDFSGAKFGGGFAGRDYTGDVNNIINEIPDSKDNDTSELKSLLKQLIKAIESETELDDDEKADAANQVKKIAEASKKPDDEGMQKKAKRAVNLLDTLAKGLEPAGKLATACTTVLPKIIKFLGLTII